MYKIAISGKQRSGKSTAADMFLTFFQKKNKNAKSVALADPIKYFVKQLFPEARAKCLYGSSEHRNEIISEKYTKNGKPITHRDAIIDIGTFARQYNDEIWLDHIINETNNSKDVDLYIVPDVRFVIEFNALKAAGFTMIRIYRDDIQKIDIPSETEQDLIKNEEFHHIIENNKDLSYLQSNINFISGGILQAF